MKVSDLIALLEKQPKNSQVVVWNGMVGDYMPLGDLFTVEHLKFNAQWWWSRESVDNPSYTMEDAQRDAKMYSRWDDVNPYFTEELCKKYYQKRKKKMVVIEPKPAGKTTFDRFGVINY